MLSTLLCLFTSEPVIIAAGGTVQVRHTVESFPTVGASMHGRLGAVVVLADDRAACEALVLGRVLQGARCLNEHDDRPLLNCTMAAMGAEGQERPFERVVPVPAEVAPALRIGQTVEVLLRNTGLVAVTVRVRLLVAPVAAEALPYAPASVVVASARVPRAELELLRRVKAWRDADGNEGFPAEVRADIDRQLDEANGYASLPAVTATATRDGTVLGSGRALTEAGALAALRLALGESEGSPIPALLAHSARVFL